MYHAIGTSTLFLLGMAVVMTAVLAAGLVHRSERGIGFEGMAILGVYVLGAGTLLITA